MQNMNVNGARAKDYSAPMEEMTVMNVEPTTQNPPESIHIIKSANFRIVCSAKDFTAPSEIM